VDIMTTNKPKRQRTELIRDRQGRICLACGKGPVNSFLDLKPQADVKSSWGVTFESRKIFKCQHCELQFVDSGETNINTNDMLYSKTYHDMMAGKLGNDAKSGVEEQSYKRIRMVKKYISHGRLLDVGCSTGIFMEIARKEGYEVSGLDVSSYACSIARQRLNLGADFIENASIADSKVLTDCKYDIITAWDVIEHCKDPLSDLKRLNSAVGYGKVMIIRTPNADSLFFKISILLFRLSFGRLRFPLFYLYHADHRFFFNKKSLTKMLDSSGFKALNFFPDSLLWKRFKYAECRHGFLIDLILTIIYWMGRIFSRGHGLIVIATKKC